MKLLQIKNLDGKREIWPPFQTLTNAACGDLYEIPFLHDVK